MKYLGSLNALIRSYYESTIFHGLSRSTTFWYFILPLLSFAVLLVFYFPFGPYITLYILLLGLIIPFAFWLHSWVHVVFLKARPAEKFFNKYGASKGTEEYNARVRSAVTSALIIGFILIFRPLVNTTGQMEIVKNFVFSDIVSMILADGLLIATYVVIIIFIKISRLRSDSRFNYFLTLGYLESSIAEKDGAVQNWLFRTALRSYNAYLKRIVHLELKDIEKISLTFRLGDSTYRNRILDEFIIALKFRDSNERFGLAPLLFLNREFGAKNKEDILRTETLLSGNSEIRAMLTVFLPLLIAVGSLVIEIYKFFSGG